MLAAYRATTCTLAHPNISDIHIFSDCTSALTASFNRKPSAGQHYSYNFRRTITQILSTNLDINISLSWCPRLEDARQR
jgi:hypothetical protein